MSNSDYPWEPPLAGTEAEQVLGALDRLRTTFRWKADALDAAGLQTRVGASSLTLGGLLKHLALVEDHYFSTKLTGEPPGGPWADVDWDADPDWEFTSAAPDTPEHLYRLWDEAVERSRARTDAPSPTAGSTSWSTPPMTDGRRASLRRLLCDLIEEYGRHTGHADLLREADGLVGEDPPAGWRPVGPPAHYEDPPTKTHPTPQNTTPPLLAHSSPRAREHARQKRPTGSPPRY